MRSADFVIIVVYMAGTVLFGMWVGRKQKGVSDYLLGERNVPWWAVLLSIVATETSTVTFLSVTGLPFDIPGQPHGDMTFLQLPLGYMIGRVAVVLILLPRYFQGNLYTAYQVLHDRFGGPTKDAASGLFLLTRSLADGLRLSLTAVILDRALGIGMEASIVIVGAATIVYTWFGGMRAVVWTDCIQFVIYIAGALVAGWVVLDHVPGGWAQVVEFGRSHGKFRVLDGTLDFTKAHTLWAGLIGGAFLSLGSHGADQIMVQRYLCARNARQAGWALSASGLVVFAQFALFLLVGVGLACYYSLEPPAEPFVRRDDVFADFIVHQLPAGAAGLVMAAVFAAAMSTLSGSLNSCASALVTDLVLPRMKSPPSPEKSLLLTRASTVLFGLIQVAVALVGCRLASAVIQSVLTIQGFTTGILLGVFFLGVLTTRVTQPAALWALVAGLAGMSAVAFASSLAWPWYAVVGSLGTFVVGLGVQAALRKRRDSRITP